VNDALLSALVHSVIYMSFEDGTATDLQLMEIVLENLTPIRFPVIIPC
jgi:hypothetical protein